MNPTLHNEPAPVALASTPLYTLYYDPAGGRVLEWMRRRHAWHSSNEAMAHGVAMGVISRGDVNILVAGIALYHYSGDDVELGLAVDDVRAWNRGFLRYVFSYIFDTMGVTRVTVKVASDNDDSIRLIERVGFTKEGTLRRYMFGLDHAVYGMLREECRWITRGN